MNINSKTNAATEGKPMRHTNGRAHNLALLGAALLLAGCATPEQQIQKVAKDWCMTIRGSQVLPVYPLTADLQPGDVFLVQVPIDQQQALYKKRGFLPLDNNIARLNPTGYDEYYGHSFLNTNVSNLLPRDLIIGTCNGTNGTTLSWRSAPRVAFPSYSFSVQNGAGLSLAVPVHGVPVGLSLLGSEAASGSIQIQEARTLGVDTLSLYLQVKAWSTNTVNAAFLRNFRASAKEKKNNFLRVVTRIFAAGRMVVTLKDAGNRSGGLDVGAPKPVSLLQAQLPATTTNAADAALTNFTSAWSTLAEIVKAATAVTDAAGKILPGGSLRLAAASARSVSLDEAFDPPVIVGYLGFDCLIDADGKLGPPIPSQAIQDPESFGVPSLQPASEAEIMTVRDLTHRIGTLMEQGPQGQQEARRILDVLGVKHTPEQDIFELLQEQVRKAVTDRAQLPRVLQAFKSDN